jgi:hypothetical protein
MAAFNDQSANVAFYHYFSALLQRSVRRNRDWLCGHAVMDFIAGFHKNNFYF